MTPIFYLNENIDVALKTNLAVFQINSLHTLDVGNRGISDERQLEYASSKGYVIVTHNRKHFKKLHKNWCATGKTHSGILVVKCDESEILADRIHRFVEEVFPSLATPFCLSPPAHEHQNP